MWVIIGTIVGWVWDALKAVGTALVYVLQTAVLLLKHAAEAIWNGARFAWTHVLKPVGQWLDRIYQRVKVFYEKIYSKVHAWLARITKAVRGIYDTYFRPVLNTIDNVRRVLHLLALLGVDLAAKLDAELAALERKITAPIEKVIEVVNAIDSRIEAYILTIDNLFKRVTMLRTVARDVGAIANIQWRAMMRHVPKRADAGKPAHATLITVDAHVAFFNELLSEQTPAADSVVGQGVALLDNELAAA